MIDFHNHTALCGHAEGTPEEYIEKAIERGISIIGFSDHAPLPEHMRSGITMMPSQIEQYIENILQLREKYKTQIDIRLGFEVDFPLRDSFSEKYFSDERIDYFIGSCHYIGDWPVDQTVSIPDFEIRGVDNVYRDYCNIIFSLVDSGLFNIVGHIDITKKYGFRPSVEFLPEYHELLSKIARKAKEKKVAIEINLSGLRKPVKEIYPSLDVLRTLIENGAPITIGSDSHTANDVGLNNNFAINMLHSCGCNKIASFKKKRMEEYAI